MDYIIFGIGAGATLVLAGWLFRDWGPRLRDRTPGDDDLLSARDLVARMAWARFCATSGMAIVLCGLLVLLVTTIAAVMTVDDESGALAVLITYALAVMLMLVWAALFVRQFGVAGIVRPKEPAAPVTASVAEGATPVATAVPAQSFAAAVASRGGLGRFRAFFRKGEPEPANGASLALETSPAGTDTVPAAASVIAEAGSLSPTEAVIAALGGEAGVGMEKRLDPADPLVTSVVGDRYASATVAGAGTANTVIEGSGVSQEIAPVTTDGEPAGDPAEAPREESAVQENPLDTLRRRRIERLSKGSSTG